jgi:hypothetical protein
LEISHKSVLYRKIAVEGISSFVWMIDFWFQKQSASWDNGSPPRDHSPICFFGDLC